RPQPRLLERQGAARRAAGGAGVRRRPRQGRRGRAARAGGERLARRRARGAGGGERARGVRGGGRGDGRPRLAGLRGLPRRAGGMAVSCPPAFALALLALAAVTAATRSFAIGARVAVFALPVLQAPFTPVAQVAATGALMCLIGLRFAQAALAARRRPGGERAG